MTSIPDSFRQWIASNLIYKASPESLKQEMLKHGYSSEEIDIELNAALNHPYIEAGKNIQNVLSRREALLKTLDTQQRNIPEYLQPKKIPLPPFKQFLEEYYYPNRLGIFSGAIDHWEARHWTPRKLVDKIGKDTMVEVQYGRDEDPNYETNSNKHKQLFPFGQFIDMVENAGTSNNFYMVANNLALANPSIAGLKKEMGNIGDGYLSEDPEKQFGMFLWIGPKGTLTPLHHDLTNNMFIQIYGNKTFRLIPSLQAPYMYNNLHVFSDVDYNNPRPEAYPEYSRASIIEVEVGPGDFLFIPIGWWHHVTSESISISTSYTNFNAANEFVDYHKSRY